MATDSLSVMGDCDKIYKYDFKNNELQKYKMMAKAGLYIFDTKGADMNNVRFDLVTDDEQINELSKMAMEIWHEYFPSIISVEQIDYMVDMFLSQKSIKEEIKDGYEFYFENNGEKNVGFMVVRPEKERLFISKLYVHKNYRGKGYGAPMFDNAIKIAEKNGLDTMYLTVNKENTPSINIYKHKGFKVIDSVKNDIGNGFYMDDYIFEYKIEK